MISISRYGIMTDETDTTATKQWQWGTGEPARGAKDKKRSDVKGKRDAGGGHKGYALPGQKKQLRKALIAEKRAERAEKGSNFDAPALCNQLLAAHGRDLTGKGGEPLDIVMASGLNKFARKVALQLGRLLQYNCSEQGSGSKRNVTFTMIVGKDGTRKLPSEEQIDAARSASRAFQSRARGEEVVSVVQEQRDLKRKIREMHKAQKEREAKFDGKMKSLYGSAKGKGDGEDGEVVKGSARVPARRSQMNSGLAEGGPAFVASSGLISEDSDDASGDDETSDDSIESGEHSDSGSSDSDSDGEEEAYLARWAAGHGAGRLAGAPGDDGSDGGDDSGSSSSDGSDGDDASSESDADAVDSHVVDASTPHVGLGLGASHSRRHSAGDDSGSDEDDGSDGDAGGVDGITSSLEAVAVGRRTLTASAAMVAAGGAVVNVTAVSAHASGGSAGRRKKASPGHGSGNAGAAGSPHHTGAWETHTRGIGSRLMAQMGYAGGALGRRAPSVLAASSLAAPAHAVSSAPDDGQASAACAASDPWPPTLVIGSRGRKAKPQGMPAPIQVELKLDRKGLGAS